MILHSATAFYQRRLPLGEVNTFIFSTFCYLHFVVPYFLWQSTWGVSNKLMLSLRFIAIILCLLVILKKFWPKWLLQNVFPLFWLFSILYTLPFVTTVMFLATKGASEWVVTILMSTLLLIFLVDWLTFLFIVFLGCVLGFLFYAAYAGGVENMFIDEDSKQLFFYQTIFGLITGSLFSWQRQKQSDYNIQQTQLLAGALKDKIKHTTTGIQRYAKNINVGFAYKKINKFTDANGNDGYFIEKRFYDNLSKMGPEIVKMSAKTRDTATMFRNAVKQNGDNKRC